MVLWVDDDSEYTLISFIHELQEKGFTVIVANNPDKMWEVLNEYGEKITGIIMDVMMPTGNSISSEAAQKGTQTGLRLIENIRAVSRYTHLPFLIFTIRSEQEIFQWAQRNSVKAIRKQETLPSELVNEIIACGFTQG